MKVIAHRSAQYWLWPWLVILAGLLLTLWLLWGRLYQDVCYPHRDCPIPETVPAALSLEAAGNPAQLVFQSMGSAGKYPLYTVRLVTRP